MGVGASKKKKTSKETPPAPTPAAEAPKPASDPKPVEAAVSPGIDAAQLVADASKDAGFLRLFTWPVS